MSTDGNLLLYHVLTSLPDSAAPPLAIVGCVQRERDGALTLAFFVLRVIRSRRLALSWTVSPLSASTRVERWADVDTILVVDCWRLATDSLYCPTVLKSLYATLSVVCAEPTTRMVGVVGSPLPRTLCLLSLPFSQLSWHRQWSLL